MLPRTVMTLTVKGSWVEVSVRHAEAETQRTECYVCLCGPQLLAVETQRVVIPPGNTDSVTLSSWLTVERVVGCSTFQPRVVNFIIAPTLDHVNVSA